jgi:acetyl esterase/lipase
MERFMFQTIGVVFIALLVLCPRGVVAQEASDSAALKTRMPRVFADFSISPDIIYKRVGPKLLELDLLVPKEAAQTPTPTVVYIHGGGWGGGDRYRILRPCEAGVVQLCGKAGIACATIEYRLTDETSTAYDAVVDCRDALRYLVKNAKRYNLDPARMATFGGSAGGHLSLMTALGKPEDFPGDPGLAGFDPPSLKCEVAFYPATDFTDPRLAERFVRANRARIMFGGPVDEMANLVRLLSPVHQIRRESTPVYLFHGDKDTVLSVENSRRLFERGKAVGADIRFTEVKGGKHGFGIECSPSIDEIGQMAADYLIQRLIGRQIGNP